MSLACMQAIRELQHRDLIEVFNDTFYHTHNTRIEGYGAEPIYLPADTECDYHRIIFTRDYAASALHEIAHWLVAGERRRTLEDYGYWYAPDGRSADQQQAFEKVEVRPQAIEWVLSVAAGRRFRVSADNLEANLGASDQFKQDIYAQVRRFVCEGVPGRCASLIASLEKASGVGNTLTLSNYSLEHLG